MFVCLFVCVCLFMCSIAWLLPCWCVGLFAWVVFEYLRDCVVVWLSVFVNVFVCLLVRVFSLVVCVSVCV